MNRKEFITRLGTTGAAAMAAPLLGTSSLEAMAFEARKRVGDKVRVGVIGCGSVSGMYLPHLSKCPFLLFRL
jgi:hypothetical protein